MPTGTFFGEDIFAGPKNIRIRATVKTIAGSQMLLEGFDFAANSITAGMSVTGPGVPEGTTVTSVVNGVVHLSKSLNITGVGHLSICTSGELPGAGTEVVFAPPRGSDGFTIYDAITPEFWLSRLNNGGGLLNVKHEDNPWGYSPANSFWASAHNNPTEEISVENAANLVFQEPGFAIDNHSDLVDYIVYLPLENKIFKLTITAWYDCGDGNDGGAAWIRTTPVDVVTPLQLPLYTKTAALTVTKLSGNDVQLTLVYEPEFPNNIDIQNAYPISAVVRWAASYPVPHQDVTMVITAGNNTATTIVTTVEPTTDATKWVNISSITDANDNYIYFYDSRNSTQPTYVGW